MRGSILGYDAGAGVSVVRGEDGRRYAFAPSAWRESRPPRKGDLVDFEPRGDRAELVFLLTPPRERGRTGPEPGTLLASAGRQPWGRLVLEHPLLAAAALVLLAGFAETYRFGSQAISLYEVPDLIAGFARALDGTLGRDAGAGARTAGDAIRFALPLLLLLYAVPAMAARVAWRELTGRSATVAGKWAGLAAMALPILLPLLVAIAAHVFLLPRVEATALRLGAGGIEVPQHGFDVLRLYGTGTILLAGAGLLLWALATGRFQPLRTAQQEGDTSAGPVLRDGAASFAPPSRRPARGEEKWEMSLPRALRRRRPAASDRDDAAKPPAAVVGMDAPASTDVGAEADVAAADYDADSVHAAPPEEDWVQEDGGDPYAFADPELHQQETEPEPEQEPELAEMSDEPEMPDEPVPSRLPERRRPAPREEADDPVMRRFEPENLSGERDGRAGRAAPPPEREAAPEPRKAGGGGELAGLSALAFDLRSALESEIARDPFATRTKSAGEAPARRNAADPSRAEPDSGVSSRSAKDEKPGRR